MEATLEKNRKNGLRKNRKERGPVSEKKEVHYDIEPEAPVYETIVLKEQDYDELMAWKRQRRETQDNRSTMFFFIGLALALTMVIVAFEWKFVDDAVITELTMDNADWEEIQDIPQTTQPPPPPPQQVIQQPVIVEVPDEEILEEIEVDMDVEITEDMAVEEVEFEMVIEEEKAEEIFMIVEDKPEPKGGVKAFYQYVAENVRYPNKAREDKIQGRVFVQFVVNSKGQISDVVTVKGIGGGCDEEAVRIVSAAPDWNPGKQRGKPVSVRMVLPITFKLF
ncbi:MAG: energy transducer TonB [Reichenbachiella sp.]|uniref:energy transducer TonB n=1 Tax=Reichenbachiella sp. TaxID=2184521 RepID=UPI00296710FD|nr:energy transducer TonB [Reichenbachiella sp.]MDW3210142.1 energy transducer TonB [Reichenbachiella sp.]